MDAIWVGRRVMAVIGAVVFGVRLVEVVPMGIAVMAIRRSHIADRDAMGVSHARSNGEREGSNGDAARGNQQCSCNRKQGSGLPLRRQPRTGRKA